ncbi:GntR family transcriptional regulator [Aminipila luticellarii]|uniref:GntR family transcriptional regulator n=1 Tax=Aminipila luticellarii TaxID=2507160 RepID=A0A410PYH7_9FIRM|nr:GntR family transcriptional regulator [Aminipila luticellarii]QAT44017.1 GntR family transcriptional regulator [Aminipila luticellarii]
METTIPTYIKIMQTIRQEIVSGVLEPDQKMASIKELSGKYHVNPNTVQRALANLEEEGLVKSRRTAGKYVTDNRLLIKSVRCKEARKITEEFLSSLEQLGIHPDELVSLFSEPKRTENVGTA